jgi:hypothetical protein
VSILNCELVKQKGGELGQKSRRQKDHTMSQYDGYSRNSTEIIPLDDLPAPRVREAVLLANIMCEFPAERGRWHRCGEYSTLALLDLQRSGFCEVEYYSAGGIAFVRPRSRERR